METINNHMLTILTFLPLVGALFMMLIPGGEDTKANNAKKLALLFSVVTFILSLTMLKGFEASSAAMQFEIKSSWIESLGANYHMGVDGISVLFVVLTALLTPICILVSWNSIKERVPLYMASFLALEAFVIGVFCALDLLLFYVFWEAMLIPMFLIIGVWGGENRVYAALKFFLYTFLGSVLMLVALVYLYLENGNSFDILSMHGMFLDTNVQMWLFLAFFVAFAVKVPMWPFHTWLPDAHVQAPTAGSVILAGILLKMGAYGFLRFSIPIMPEASYIFTPYIYALSAIAIVYTALVAFAQTDVKKMIAYSSVSHMGFVTLGIFAATVESMQGSVMQMVNHGIVSSALFMLIGVIYDRMHTRDITRFGGIVNRMPFYAAIFMLFTMAAVGLPGTNSFVGEFLILTGAYTAENTQLYVVVACLGIVLGAVYMLSLYKRMVMGEPVTQEIMRLKHMDKREKLMFMPLVILVLYLGFAPNKMLNVTEASVTKLVADYSIQVASYKNKEMQIAHLEKN